jgi:hypothetical protein
MGSRADHFGADLLDLVNKSLMVLKLVAHKELPHELEGAFRDG